MQILNEFKVIGLALKTKTTNENGQSAIDCGNLWQQFGSGGFADKIPGRTDNDVLAVYYNYEGGHTKPFCYLIGCRVTTETEVPDGMDSIIIPAGNYYVHTAKGKMPECISKAWIEIWKSDIPRAYKNDLEVYNEKSKDWSNAEVDILLSVT